jgi:hypothetical protein
MAHTVRMTAIITPLANPDCCVATTLLPARSRSHPSVRVAINAQCQREPGHAGKHEIFEHLIADAWWVIPTRWSLIQAHAVSSRT